MKLHESARLLLLGIVLSTVASCSLQPNQNTPALPCSEDWLAQVEQQIATGDNQGHGPDLDSIEWRHTVEFKLGLRGSTDIPARNSTAWCEYINKHIIQINN
jgi:hypothetical protein